ncbi:hypothetical protein D8I30_12780 [Brevundimonas naejangsanensis]|uniref:Uncharacterized protein n=1 Tax=Brevundimonas naejangsanensis TaxID=588932 RepID=A0A494RMG8_9CAUL|nr:hypothetical protein [Brevundimonas naejangsanensis]AYG95950.1 hypothetical protein D8I30_12780 [Brevundimonas naejangsanensis]
MRNGGAAPVQAQPFEKAEQQEADDAEAHGCAYPEAVPALGLRQERLQIQVAILEPQHDQGAGDQADADQPMSNHDDGAHAAGRRSEGLHDGPAGITASAAGMRLPPQRP